MSFEQESLTQAITDLPYEVLSPSESSKSSAVLIKAESNSFEVIDESHTKLIPQLKIPHSDHQLLEQVEDYQQEKQPLNKDSIDSDKRNKKNCQIMSDREIPWNRTGARPKDIGTHPSSSSRPDNINTTFEGKGQMKPDAPIISESRIADGGIQNAKKTFSIPRDQGMYRINHQPHIQFYHDQSMTGISDISSLEPRVVPAAPIASAVTAVTAMTESQATNTSVSVELEHSVLNDLNLGHSTSTNNTQEAIVMKMVFKGLF